MGNAAKGAFEIRSGNKSCSLIALKLLWNPSGSGGCGDAVCNLNITCAFLPQRPSLGLSSQKWCHLMCLTALKSTLPFWCTWTSWKVKGGGDCIPTNVLGAVRLLVCTVIGPFLTTFLVPIWEFLCWKFLCLPGACAEMRACFIQQLQVFQGKSMGKEKAWKEE